MTEQPRKKCVRQTCHRKAYSRAYGGLCEFHLVACGKRLPKVPNDIVMDFLQPWTDAGYIVRNLVESAGINKGTAADLMAGRDLTGSRFDTLVKNMDPSKCAWQPAYRVRRRLCSLRGAGISPALLASEVGCSRQMISFYCEGKTKHVRLAVMDRVIEVWDRYKLTFPGARDEAAERENYPLPMSWDDIDDPYEGSGGIPAVLFRPYSRKSA